MTTRSGSPVAERRDAADDVAGRLAAPRRPSRGADPVARRVLGEAPAMSTRSVPRTSAMTAAQPVRRIVSSEVRRHEHEALHDLAELRADGARGFLGRVRRLVERHDLDVDAAPRGGVADALGGGMRGVGHGPESSIGSPRDPGVPCAAPHMGQGSALRALRVRLMSAADPRNLIRFVPAKGVQAPPPSRIDGGERHAHGGSSRIPTRRRRRGRRCGSDAPARARRRRPATARSSRPTAALVRVLASDPARPRRRRRRLARRRPIAIGWWRLASSCAWHRPTRTRATPSSACARRSRRARPGSRSSARSAATVRSTRVANLPAARRPAARRPRGRAPSGGSRIIRIGADHDGAAPGHRRRTRRLRLAARGRRPVAGVRTDGLRFPLRDETADGRSGARPLQRAHRGRRTRRRPARPPARRHHTPSHDRATCR